MAQVYLGNFRFVFAHANVYFFELQYFSSSSYRMLITVYINFCEKKLNNVAAYLSITRNPSAILMYFLCCCCSVQTERKNLMYMGALLSFLLYFYIYSFSNLAFKKFTCLSPNSLLVVFLSFVSNMILCESCLPIYESNFMCLDNSGGNQCIVLN